MTQPITSGPHRSDLIVLESVIWRGAGHGDRPLSGESRFQHWTTTDEQPFVRTTTVTEAWRPVDCAWLDRVSALLVVNHEGEEWDRNPTPEELADVSRRVVEIAVEMDSSLLSAESLMGDAPAVQPTQEILPGQSARFRPHGPVKRHWIRCRHGEARVSYFATPE